MYKCRYCGCALATKDAEQWCGGRRAHQLANLTKHVKRRPPIWPLLITKPASPALSLTRRVLCGLILSVVVLAWVIIFGATLWAVGEMVR